MPIDASIYQSIRPVEMPSLMDTAQKGMSLAQLSMQNQHMSKQMEREDQAATQAEHLRRASVFGNALEGLSGLSDQERATAWPKLRQELIGQGLPAEKISEQYDPIEYKGGLLKFQQSKEGIERALQRSSIDLHKSQVAKNYAEAAKDRAAAGMTKVKDLTPGQKSADEAFGKEAAGYFYGGGKSTVEKNIQKLEGAVDTLRSNPDLTGGLTTRIPLLSSDVAQDTINPKLAAVRDEIRGAIQGTLREVLGAQFTENEGEAIFNRAFNPRLSPAENIKRATAEIEALKRMAAQKDESMKQFMASGTLRGYTPAGTNLQHAPDTAYAQNSGRSSFGMNEAHAAPSVKPGTVDGGYVFMGGDPANPKSWKKAR